MGIKSKLNDTYSNAKEKYHRHRLRARADGYISKMERYAENSFPTVVANNNDSLKRLVQGTELEDEYLQKGQKLINEAYENNILGNLERVKKNLTGDRIDIGTAKGDLGAMEGQFETYCKVQPADAKNSNLPAAIEEAKRLIEQAKAKKQK